MKILSVSDYVVSTLYENFDTERFPKIDLILSCGDLPPEYLSFLAASFNVPLYYVRGNHDIRYDSKPPDGCIDLNGRLVQFWGVNLLGLEGSRWYSGGPHQYTEKEMRKIIRGLRFKIWWQKGVDIIITHAPPRYIHDAEDLCHRGFKSFRWLIDRYCPRYFIHGHIHAEFKDPAERTTIISNTKVVNTYGYYLFEIDIHGDSE
ncbi:MAG: metallophosphoesterase [Desulfobacterales bacterium]|nr:MAG: metallophosphoesterase [Desulfobacterales bacterium]UCD91336.1 MAG: metallophosphoesterase [Desulfobacterales bacterium]